ncbi:MAG TPA: DUF998 domain-containing protein [Candidatus Bilamarchaeaceae archaeon]|nr:DUF998 domain-containing protein [Candidatus Bilamarchaeaceae archaeon]
MKLDKILQMCGILGPMNFFLITLILGLKLSNYDLISQYISELGAVGSPVKDKMNFFGLMLSGLLLILFSIPFYARIGKNLSGKIGSLFLLFSGIGMIAIGHYPCDLDCNNYSSIGEMHELSTIFTFASAVVSLLFIAYSIKDDKHLKWLSIYSFLASVLTVIFIYLFNFAETDYAGLFERIAAFIPLGFVAGLAWTLYNEKS